MTDPRQVPDPSQITCQDPGQVHLSVSDLCRRPDGPRDRQALYGDTLTVLGRTDAWCYVQLSKDGYCGYLRDTAVGTRRATSHWVSAAATHVYDAADLKSADLATLSFASQVTVLETVNGFARTPDGFIPRQHLTSSSTLATDPAKIAPLFLGTPYLWGGNSRWGIDCSGLVQAACLACGLPCPGDSDQQQRVLGDTLKPGTPYARNDLLFWAGHVALALDERLMIHANAHNMAVTIEPIADAITRIERSDGAVTAHKRLSLPNGLKSIDTRNPALSAR